MASRLQCIQVSGQTKPTPDEGNYNMFNKMIEVSLVSLALIGAGYLVVGIVEFNQIAALALR